MNTKFGDVEYLYSGSGLEIVINKNSCATNATRMVKIMCKKSKKCNSCKKQKDKTNDCWRYTKVAELTLDPPEIVKCTGYRRLNERIKV